LFYRYLFGYQQQIYEKQSSFWAFVETILRQKQPFLIPNWGQEGSQKRRRFSKKRRTFFEKRGRFFELSPTFFVFCGRKYLA